MISSDNVSALIGLIIILVGAGVALDRTRFGRHVPSAVAVMVVAIFLSNIGVTPFASKVYDVALAEFVPVGIVLLLFQTRLRTILVEARPVLFSFAIAMAATLVGVAVAVAVMDFGDMEAAIAGVFAATYIGGAMNFVAVSQLLSFSDPDLYASALAADTAVGATFFLSLILFSTLVPRGEPAQDAGPQRRDAQNEAAARPFRLGSLLFVVGAAFIISWASGPIAAALSIGQFSILVMTFLAIALANIFPRTIQQVEGVEDAGMSIMYAFFVVVGFGANFATLTGPALKFVAFASIILGVHIVIVTAAWRLFRLPLKELLVASNACVLGPATAAGMAASRGWTALVTPGLFAGVLGYAIANFIGAGVAMLLGWR